MAEGFSNLQRALIWTLPGAGLCSLPVGFLLRQTYAQWNWIPARPSDSLVRIALWVFIPTTLVGSIRAIYECLLATGRKRTRLLLVLFNLVMLMTASGIAVILAAAA